MNYLPSLNWLSDVQCLI